MMIEYSGAGMRRSFYANQRGRQMREAPVFKLIYAYQLFDPLATSGAEVGDRVQQHWAS
jgi:hypothetical protein